ncbi:SGNH/GDSL hydrolase family protein [Mangrovibacter plantisponsor]|uniref:GDSL-like lipase/acylhydrolase family protein n=1 Tax=Mangrovibacter plantisponsor TaxID=451513 RepID=A0A317PYV7_9ENTR|nr:SGNH/GDSL hydrolase family protein [Mangrovibacter plantisponsor]PWW06792.1 GDSL-like lipase/acylhydrolase family protein [Mangrovibacter plantisponsor]
MKARQFLLCAGLCGTALSATAAPVLEGMVIAEQPFRSVTVSVTDSKGLQRTAVTDNEGRYQLDVQGLSAPLRLSAMNTHPWEGVTSQDCLHNDQPRARCMASLLPELDASRTNIANITPFTDRMVSEIATANGYTGPQQWIMAKGITIDTTQLAAPLARFQAGMHDALEQVGLVPLHTNPVTLPMQPGDGMSQLLAVINHNRGYDNNSGEAAGTILTDISFRPLVGLQNAGPYEPFDYARAVKERMAILAAKTRVLIVSDSTAATYEVSRLPRMGWGQVFEQQFAPDSGVVVLNGARAGRSSRDFYNEGWYQQMARFMRAGDYVLIAHGHNDQNCNSSKPLRGAADVKNLCTYPNNNKGERQFPAGHPEMSYQTSLERYIKLAWAQGAHPVLLTSTARVKNARGKTAFVNGDTQPVVSSHHTPAKPGYLFSGDYIASVRKTAADNAVPLLDLEAATIALANQHPQDWQTYWLAVDPARYPWYQTQTSGTLANPDTTHFQQKGAETIAALVAGLVRENPQLKSLAAQLQP